MFYGVNKHPQNPIVKPGLFSWRKATVFNPAAVFDNGTFYLMERAAERLTPHQTVFGLLSSKDGVNFTHVVDRPVFTSDDVGYPYGSVEDPRIVKLDGRFYMTYALRRYCESADRINISVMKDYYLSQDIDINLLGNHTVSGIAVSDDLIHWENLGLCEPTDIDDRDVVLFPEKINGRYALLRRPQTYIKGDIPEVTLCYADTLEGGGNWGRQSSVLGPSKHPRWTTDKLGTCAPPLKTRYGWLLFYHEVDDRSVYRVGAVMLDIKDPTNVLARTPFPIMEPDAPWEKLGLVFRDVVFPCGNVVKDNTIYLYYGAADTSICLATLNLDDFLEFLMLYDRHPDLAAFFGKRMSSMSQPLCRS